MDDDDVPPPITSLPGQLEALKSFQDVRCDSEVPIATVTARGDVSKAPTLKKGFFNAKRTPQAKTSSKKSAADMSAEDIPYIRAKPAPDGHNIPDFLRVEPDEATKQYQRMRDQLLQALQPSPDTMTKVAQDPVLLAGFSDPEVMAAVSDVAGNPQAIKKYQNNEKVVKFYSSMAKMMGDRLTAMGSQGQ